jgi:hypothetical protein
MNRIGGASVRRDDIFKMNRAWGFQKVRCREPVTRLSLPVLRAPTAYIFIYSFPVHLLRMNEGFLVQAPHP